MPKKLTTTEKLRKNPYIVTTFALGLLCLLIIAGNINEARSMNKTENKIICSTIYSTPAWAINGKIFHYGIIIPENVSIDLVSQALIPQSIKMFYNPSCSACQRQIEYFIEQGTWDDYQKEGLAIDCTKILK